MPAEPLQVIGIGASAGGLEAIRAVLAQLEIGASNAAIILAQHLSPHHDSKLTELLSQQGGVCVIEARHDQELEANTLYVAPQNCEISLAANRICLRPPPPDSLFKPSIDVLFAALAEEKQDLAVGVILSGTGSDGADGIRAIHLAGGITLAQDPASAQASGMPLAAIATGCVDRVLLPEQIGRALSSLQQTASPMAPEMDRQILQKILLRLSQRSGVDFSHYKLPTLYRRLQKRLTQLELPDTRAYLSWLDAHPDEPEQLIQLLLISVTQFFRDPEAFAALKAHLEEVVAAKGSQEPIRIWVPGCATGEEAYSLAFVLCQLLQDRWQSCQLQIFASDLDERALAFARKGLYPPEAVAGLPADLLGLCFDHLGDSFQVKADIRARILFTRHDLAGHPPFQKQDLISCRNLLIYLVLSLQKQLMSIFHYALHSQGILFLGKSESIGECHDLFETLDSEHKIFRRKQGSRPRALRFSAFKPKPGRASEAPLAPEPGTYSLSGMVKETLFASFDYPYAVVNDALDIQEICGDLRLYLGVGDGQPSLNLLHLIQPELQIGLMAALTRAQRERAGCRSPIVCFDFMGRTHYVRFGVKPLLFTAKGQDLFLVIFEPIDPAEQILPWPCETAQSSETDALRHELETVRTQLQNYTEQLEMSNEQLQALNEELLSTNEEFQSTNEELETSNEELQSTYEEVLTAYAELHSTNQALEASQKEIQKAEAQVRALLNNTLQAFVLVDTGGMILTSNQEAVALFQRINGLMLRQGHLFKTCLATENQTFLADDLDLALAGEVRAGEQRVESPDGQAIWLAYNFTPVPDPQKGLQVVSISFLDISERMLAQEKLMAQDLRFKALIENSFDGIAICNHYGIFSYISPSIERMLGFPASDLLHHHSSEFIHPDDLAEMGRLIARAATDHEHVKRFQWRQRHKDGSWRWLEGMAINRYSVPEIGGTILNFRDFTARRQQEQALRVNEARLRQIIDLIPGYIYARDSQNCCLLANAMTARLFRLDPHALEGRRFDDLQGKLPEDSASLQADREVRELSVMRILPKIRFDSGQGQVQYLRSYKIPYTASDSGHPATLTVAIDLSGLRPISSSNEPEQLG